MKKYVIAGLLLAGLMTPALAAELLCRAEHLLAQMLDRDAEARRQVHDRARLGRLWFEGGSPAGHEEYVRMQGLT